MAGRSIKVVQCSIDGNDIASFPSAKDAALALGGKFGSSITRSIRYGTTSFGYRWRYFDKPLKEMRSDNQMGKARRIVVTKPDGTYIATYPSQSEAARQLGIGISLIESLLMTGGSSKDYHFYFEDLGDKRNDTPRYAREIVSLNEDGSIYEEYPSVKVAAKSLGVIPAAVYIALRKDKPNARCKGHRFRYKSEVNDE